jgi:hypothetical protein
VRQKRIEELSDEFHSEKWFILFSFNAGAFFRSGERTMLRKNWQEYAADDSKSINAWLAPQPRPTGCNDLRN